MPRIKYYNKNTNKWEYADSQYAVSGGANGESGVLCVTAQSNSSYEYTADKTAEDVYEAYMSGKSVVCKLHDFDGNYSLPLIIATPRIVVFGCAAYGLMVTLKITDIDNTVEFQIEDLITEDARVELEEWAESLIDERLSGAVKSVNGIAPDANGNVKISIPDSGGNANQGTGLTTAQINALDGMFKVCAFNSDPYDAYTAFKNAFGLSGGTVEPEEPDIPDAPDVPDVPVEPDKETYTVTNNLTNCASNNRATTIVEGSSYTATLTASDGYTLDGASISVLVNGENVTDFAYSNGVITIQNVMGNVVITATAVEIADESDEVVLLKSITGDGASWIDTEFILADSTHTMELSARFTSDEGDAYLMGADGYNFGTGYGKTSVNKNTVNALNVFGNLNGGSFANLGSWYNTDANSLRLNQFFLVLADGSQVIYLDAEHTTQQTHQNAACTTKYGTAEFVPIPLYLFTVNKTEAVNATYTPCDSTIYFFKITDADGNVVLNLLPAKQGSKVGMYDTVAQKFHENKGTGTFSYEEVSA